MLAFGRILGVALVVATLALLSAVAVGQVGALSAAGAHASNAGPSYNATFTETGLPTGTNWSVHVGYVGCGCDGVHKTFTSNLPSITVLLTNGSYRYSVLVVPGYFVNVSAKGMFNVSGANPPAIPIIFHPAVLYTTEFTESGLSPGTLWTASVAGNGRGQEWALEHVTESSHSASMNFTVPNGTYRYTVSPVHGAYFSGPSHGKFKVSGASPSTILVAFVTPPTYAITFTEHGLAAGTNWSVRVDGSGVARVHESLSTTSDAIVFSLPTGTYRYTVAEVLGYVLNGTSVGHLTVATVPLGVNVSFRAVGPGAFYPVTFEENGLAGGTHWVVKVIATHTFGHSRTAEQSSNDTTLTFHLQNGTYRYDALPIRGYSSSGAAGTFTIIGASPAVMVVTFTLVPTYTVTFTESGLPNATNWTDLVRTEPGGSSVWPVHITETSNSTTIVFTLPDGSYCYQIHAVRGYHITTGTAAGSFSVTGASPPGITVGFSPKG
ncbi:MAG: hypothetical protein ACLQD8_03840 [Thermoplasmata archaeon]